MESIVKSLWEVMSGAWDLLFYFCMLMLMAMGVRWAVLMFGIGKPRDSIRVGFKAVVILGSGGHTKEILTLVRTIADDFISRVYVSTSSDPLSLDKARELERQLGEDIDNAATYTSVLRIRDVGQSLISSLARAPRSFIQSVMILITEKPDLLLCNGPGVCVPFCVFAYVLNTLRVTKTRIIFVESICRVHTISLSGHLVIPLVDKFIVQWRELYRNCKADYPNANVVYLGRLT